MFRLNADTILIWTLRLCALTAGLIVLLITAFLLVESIPAFRSIGFVRFVNDDAWQPASDAADGLFWLVPMVLGSLVAMAGAVLIATPLGIASAAFCQFYAPPHIARVYRRIVELLAGIPSVVYGLWGLVVLVPIIRAVHPPGPSLLAAVIVLSIMILPTIALMADAAFANVPAQQLRAASALGLSRWATLRGVVLPSSRSGIFTGVILETGRAIGETMAVLMVAGNIVQLPVSPFEGCRTLTSNIALELGYALGDHRAALFVSGLILIGMIASLVGAAEWISKGRLYG
ncbi:MAG: phosphate ABC transporter permease subunit PstC [Planctomycetota bacterium]